MAKQKEIDRLTKEANEAMQPAEPIKQKDPALLHPARRGAGFHPERELVCTVCGKVYVGRHPKRLYCSEICRDRAYHEMKKTRKELAKSQGGEINA